MTHMTVSASLRSFSSCTIKNSVAELKGPRKSMAERPWNIFNLGWQFVSRFQSRSNIFDIFDVGDFKRRRTCVLQILTFLHAFYKF